MSRGARGREVHVSRGARCRTVHVVERRTWLRGARWSRGARCRDVRAREARGTSSEQSCCGSTRSREVATSFPVFFSFGFMCKCLWEAPVGFIIESSKCCRVFAFIRIFFALCLLLYMIDCLYSCVIKCAYLMFSLHSVSFHFIETPSCVT